MKKLLILFLILIVSSCATQKHTQRTLINVGTGPNTGTGESLRSMAIKLNLYLAKLDAMGIFGTYADSSDFNFLDDLPRNILPLSAVPEVPTIFSAAGDTAAYPTPGKIGNIFIDTSAGKVYISVTAVRNGWRILN